VGIVTKVGTFWGVLRLLGLGAKKDRRGVTPGRSGKRFVSMFGSRVQLLEQVIVGESCKL
jgi:hypothetical protein